MKSQKLVSSQTLRQHCSENKIQTSIFHACGTLQIWYKIRGLKSKSGLPTTELVGGGVETFFFIWLLIIQELIEKKNNLLSGFIRGLNF